MWILMIMLVLVGWALTGVKLSLMKGARACVVALITALIPLACYRLSLGLNTREVALVVADYRVMTTIATIAVVESLAVTILSIELMREHYGARPPRRLTMLIRRYSWRGWWRRRRSCSTVSRDRRSLTWRPCMPVWRWRQLLWAASARGY